MDDLTVMTAEEAGAIRLTVRGELDLATVPQLVDAIADAEARGREALVLDLASVDFMDSTGLQLLLDVDRRAEADGRALTLVAGEGAVRRVLDLAGVLPRMRVADVR